MQAFELTEERRLAAAKEAWLSRQPAGTIAHEADLFDRLGPHDRRKLVLGHSEEIMADAVAGGVVDPGKVYSYTDWEEHFGRLGDRWNRGGRTIQDEARQSYWVGWLELEVNHGVPRRELLALQRNTPGGAIIHGVQADLDVPSFPFKKTRHGAGMGEMTPEGTYLPTFHDLLTGNARRGVTGLLSRSETSPMVIRARIRDAYREMQARYGAIDDVDYDRMGDIVDAFLHNKGVP